MADNYTFKDASGSTRTARSSQIGAIDVPSVFVATAVATVLGFQQITVTGAAATLASYLSGAVIPTGATHALVRGDSANAAAVRWRDDGTNPTTSVGFELTAGDWTEWVNLAGIRLIAVSGSQILGMSFRKYDS
jgi:hypothetical protein